MIAEAVRRSALADYRERFDALTTASRGELSLREIPFLSQITLRADPNDADLMRRLAAALGFTLPLMPNTVTSRAERHALWLGPDEWLVIGPDGQGEALEQLLCNALEDAFGSIVDVSANRTVLEIGGAKASQLLAHGLPIDIGARTFGPNRCAQTLLAKAQVIIERRDAAVFQLHARTSFARYVADWLLDAAAPDLTSGQ